VSPNLNNNLFFPSQQQNDVNLAFLQQQLALASFIDPSSFASLSSSLPPNSTANQMLPFELNLDPSLFNFQQPQQEGQGGQGSLSLSSVPSQLTHHNTTHRRKSKSSAGFFIFSFFHFFFSSSSSFVPSFPFLLFPSSSSFPPSPLSLRLSVLHLPQHGLPEAVLRLL
jgi:hypothetical protein